MTVSTPKPLKREITINKEWYDKLVVIVDNLNEAIISGDDVDQHGWISHLNGYVHSLNEYFKMEDL